MSLVSGSKKKKQDSTKNPELELGHDVPNQVTVLLGVDGKQHMIKLAANLGHNAKKMDGVTINSSYVIREALRIASESFAKS